MNHRNGVRSLMSQKEDQSYRKMVANMFELLSRTIIERIRDGRASAVKFEWRYGDPDVALEVMYQPKVPAEHIQLNLDLGEEFHRLTAPKYQQLSFDFADRVTH